MVHIWILNVTEADVITLIGAASREHVGRRLRQKEKRQGKKKRQRIKVNFTQHGTSKKNVFRSKRENKVVFKS